jgi:predicted nuclease of predicted toxin-antitoxin system
MKLAYYTDTHIAKQIAIQLRQHGVRVIRCEDVGLAEADDERHLAYATEAGCVLLTFDKGFRDRAFGWLADNRSHGGVIICKDDLQGPGGIGTIVRECLFFYEAVAVGAATLDDFRNRVIDLRR